MIVLQLYFYEAAQSYQDISTSVYFFNNNVYSEQSPYWYRKSA